MFDWARGAVLKKMVQEQLIEFYPTDPIKSWEIGWVQQALLDFPPGTKVLDIGSGNYAGDAQRYADRGCEAHILEQMNTPDMPPHFGMTQEVIEKHPDITFHSGLMGQEIPPAGYYDLITCISVMEHFYDADSPMNPDNPMPHLDGLRDMVRMLAPGGVLVLTYGVFLNHSVPWHHGWDYLTDIAFLQRSGLQLLYPKKPVRSYADIYNSEDTLFYGPEAVFEFSDQFWRETSIGMMFRKPGLSAQVQLSPKPNLVNVLFQDVMDRDFQPSFPSASNLNQASAEVSKAAIAKILERVSATSLKSRLSPELLNQLETLHAELLRQFAQSQEHIANLETNLARSQEQIAHFHQGLTESQERIKAMESSKFWQLRKRWFQLKRGIGLSVNE